MTAPDEEKVPEDLLEIVEVAHDKACTCDSAIDPECPSYSDILGTARAAYARGRADAPPRSDVPEIEAREAFQKWKAREIEIWGEEPTPRTKQAWANGYEDGRAKALREAANVARCHTATKTHHCTTDEDCALEIADQIAALEEKKP